MTRNLLNDVFDFMRLTHQFREVKRTVHLLPNAEQENDVEHSYQLTMIAWYLVTKHKLPLDLTLVIKYALVHDLVEAYAGDSCIYSGDPDREVKKQKAEAAAMERLQKEFPDFRDLHHLIAQYEKKTYKEAQFVWALDKVIPIWNIYLADGKSWQIGNITLEMLVENKTPKVKKSDIINDYFAETVKLLQEEEERLFNT